MSQKLVIRLEGDSPLLGSEERGVSLKFFAAYAERLRNAYQRSAQAVLTGTVQVTGRLPNRAAEVDVRLENAQAGSLTMALRAIDEATAPELATIGLADRALGRLVDDLDWLRRKGEEADVSHWVRELIASVPEQVEQRYQHYTNGHCREVVISSAVFGASSSEPALARVDRLQCSVRGVLMSPRTAVLLQAESGRLEVMASDEMLEHAWKLRGRLDLVATVVTTSAGRRLLALRSMDEQESLHRVPPVQETIERFDDVLRRLAQ